VAVENAVCDRNTDTGSSHLLLNGACYYYFLKWLYTIAVGISFSRMGEGKQLWVGTSLEEKLIFDS
jgi:hypothetical protein